MVLRRTDSNQLPKWLLTCSAAIFVVAIASATAVDAQRTGYSRDDAELPDAPAGNPSGLGRRPYQPEMRQMAISIAPDGAGLPPGSGTAAQGATLFAPRGCADCHGPNGHEGPGPVLVDFDDHRSRIKRFPFAPLIWDFMRRAMPYDRPGRLTNDEVYALTAYLLFRNGIIEETDVLDAKSLARIQMPHRAEYTPPAPWRPSGAPRMFKILP